MVSSVSLGEYVPFPPDHIPPSATFTVPDIVAVGLLVQLETSNPAFTEIGLR